MLRGNWRSMQALTRPSAASCGRARQVVDVTEQLRGLPLGQRDARRAYQFADMPISL